MDASTKFLLYAGVYRLTVLAIGALSIYLGFRLLNQAAARRSADATNTSSASAKGGGFELIVTNFLPGHYLALFGTIIISIMVWQGPPERIVTEKVIAPANGQPVEKTNIEQQRVDDRINLDGSTKKSSQ